MSHGHRVGWKRDKEPCLECDLDAARVAIEALERSRESWIENFKREHDRVLRLEVELRNLIGLVEANVAPTVLTREARAVLEAP